MASSHSRNASTADRRNINAAGLASRAASVRARDYEKPHVRDDGSPIMSENSADPTDMERMIDKQRRQASDFERRTERTFTTTKEKTIRTRSPVKESASAGNRREQDRVRRIVQSPIEKKKPKEFEQGMSGVLGVLGVLESVLTIRRTMDARCYVDSSFIRSPGDTGFSSAFVIRCACFSSTATVTRIDNARARGITT